MMDYASLRFRAFVAAIVCLAVGALSFVCPTMRADTPVREEKTDADAKSGAAEKVGQGASDQQNLLASILEDNGSPLLEDSLIPLTAPFDTAQAKASQESWARKLGKRIPVEKNSIGMELVLIPPGKYTMGSPVNEKDRQDSEAQVAVTLTKAFYIGKMEVTQSQWQAVMETTPWKERDSVREGDNYAATYVSWDDAQAFCKTLSEKENTKYRLPTEAEWEFACRAGTTTPFSFGNDDSKLSDHAWWGGILGDGSAKDEQYAHEVGRKLANPFGVHDLYGNVWEWCEDTYVGKLPGGADPFISDGGLVGVCRGGGWNSFAFRCRSAFRNRIVRRHGLLPGSRYSFLGFRLVRVTD